MNDSGTMVKDRRHFIVKPWSIPEYAQVGGVGVIVVHGAQVVVDRLVHNAQLPALLLPLLPLLLFPVRRNEANRFLDCFPFRF